MTDSGPPWLFRFRPGADWRLFDWDPVNKVVQWARPRDDDTLEVVTQMLATEELLKQNHELETSSNGVRWGDGRMVASVPINVAHASGLMQAVREKDKPWFRRWMNNPDNRRFRTFRGRV